MKTILVLGSAMIATAAIAQTLSTPLPETSVQFWELAIGAVSPMIVWLAKTLVPKIPTVLLPSVTPLIGIGLGLLLRVTNTAELSWVDSAQAGALAVFFREVFNQAVTKRMDETNATAGK